MSEAKNTPAKSLTENDFAPDKIGKNQLYGRDQASVRNQRHAVPDSKQKTEGVVESFENADAKVRSAREKDRRC